MESERLLHLGKLKMVLVNLSFLYLLILKKDLNGGKNEVILGAR
jgi:hypothetical protein